MIATLLSDRWFPLTLGIVGLIAAPTGMYIGALIAYLTRPRPPRTPITWEAID